MAILRGGRRIGNFDIRLGFPRDRSLDNVEGDPRLQRKPGGNPESTMGKFISAINQGEGVARPTRYVVRFFMPQKYKLGDVGRKQETYGPPPYQTYQDYNQQELQQNVSMMCNKVTMPSRDINTTSHMTYGPAREMPYAYSFPGTVEMTFYADKFLRQRVFFEEWQKLIMNTNSHNMRFYDDYIGHMDIYQLGSFESNDDRDRITYGVRLLECYPQVIGGVEYAYGTTDQPHNLPITFNFRNWYNLTTDQINGATIGQKMGDVPTIKTAKNFGLFGGILDKLPPELKRVGRDVLGQIKRNAPIGRITGGRVFPPFI